MEGGRGGRNEGELCLGINLLPFLDLYSESKLEK
jgi:hypothetical protein